MFFEAECWEMHAGAEDLCFGQNAHTTNAIEVHLRVGVAIRVAQVGEMRTPCSIFSIAFDNDGVFIERFGKFEGRL